MRTDQCEYWFRRGTCKYGDHCRYSHDMSQFVLDRNLERYTEDGLPIRPGEKPCGVYFKTGNCPYGARCKFDHLLQFMNGSKTPIETSLRNPTPMHHQRNHQRRAKLHPDPRRFPGKRIFRDPGQSLIRGRGSNTPVALSNENSPSQYGGEQSPRSTNEASGNMYHQSCSPCSHSQQPNPTSVAMTVGPTTATIAASSTMHGTTLGRHHDGFYHLNREVVGGFHFPFENEWFKAGDRCALEKGHEMIDCQLTHLFQAVEQKKDDQKEFSSITNSPFWPYVQSCWYQSGRPNDTMRMRLEKEITPKLFPNPTMASHLLKPSRGREESFLQD